MKNLIAATLLLFTATTTIDAQIVNRFRDSTIFYNRVQFDNTVRITDGAQNGYVLTSDATGNATWQPGGGSGSAWSLTGNAGTNPATNFIGTTDGAIFSLRPGPNYTSGNDTVCELTIGTQIGLQSEYKNQADNFTNAFGINPEEFNAAVQNYAADTGMSFSLKKDSFTIISNVGSTNIPTFVVYPENIKIDIPSKGNGKVLTSDANGLASWQTPSAGGTPAGSTNYIQYNSSGSFGADSLFTRNASTFQTNILRNAQVDTLTGLQIGSFLGGINGSGLLYGAPTISGFKSISVVYKQSNELINTLQAGQIGSTQYSIVQLRYNTSNTSTNATVESRGIASGRIAYMRLRGTDSDSASKPFSAGYSNDGNDFRFFSQSGDVGYTYYNVDYSLPYKLDSATIYSITPAEFTTRYCTDCTGNGVTGRIVTYIGSAWRRLQFD